MNTANDVVITGLGLVSGAGTGADAQMDLITGKIARSERSLESFRAAAHLSDKRMMKAISHSDSIGLAAVELLRKDAGWETVKAAPERIGMYVGCSMLPGGHGDRSYADDCTDPWRHVRSSSKRPASRTDPRGSQTIYVSISWRCGNVRYR